MSDDAKLFCLVLMAVIIVSLCLLGGCVTNHYFALEAAKVGLKPEGGGQSLRYVPIRESD